MKKRFLFRTLAFILALALPFSVSAAATEGGGTDAAVNITVGEILPVKQLLESMGYDYYVDYERTVYSVTCSGAVRSAKNEGTRDDLGRYSGTECVYGTQAGQGTATITFRDDTPPLEIKFNVTAFTSNPLIKEISVLMEDRFSIEPLLKDAGYASDDVVHYAYWDVTNHNGLTFPVEILSNCGIFTPPEFESNHNGSGEGQILLNMKDGQVILINVTVKRSFALGLWELYHYFFFRSIPDDYVVRSQERPWNILVLLFTPVDWILNGMAKLRSTHNVTPALVF